MVASQNKNSYQRTGFKKNIKNYNTTIFNQLWCNNVILQDKQGIIYVGSLEYTSKSGNLHQFDGVSWRIINSPDSGVHSMAMDDKGTIYIGGYNEIGYIIPDSKKIIQYISLVNQLEKDKKYFGYVFYTHSTKEGIYFNCRKYLIRFNHNSKKLKVWQSKQNERFLSSFKCQGVLFINQENVGLMRMENGELKLVPGGKFFKDKRICMMVIYNAKKILIGTRKSGLYILEGRQSSPFFTEADRIIKKNHLNHGIRLSSGDFALGTAYRGLIIMDAMGKIKEIYDKSYGLLDNNIYYIFQDVEGNLWLAFDSGISRLEYISPISKNDNLSLYFYSIIKHRDILYVGTENGLFFLDANRKFFHIPGTSSFYFDLLSIDDSLISATSEGIYQLIGDKNNIIIAEDFFYRLLQSQIDTNRIWVTGYNGLFSIYRKNNRWKKEYHFKNITHQIESIVEDEKGNLWLGLNYGKIPSKNTVLKVDFPSIGSISSPLVKGYSITQQVLPNNACYVYKAGGHVVFSTRKGLFRFDKKNKDFTPDFMFGNQFAGGFKNKNYIAIIEDKNSNIWFRSKNSIYLAKPNRNNSYSVISVPFNRIQSFYPFPIYPDPHEDITWIGGKGKLIRYDTTIQKNYNLNFPTLIRSVKANGRLVYGGNKINGENNSQSLDFVPTINYDDRSLSFKFAAPFFEDESRTQYRYQLEGYDKNWSDWGWETKKEYNSLPAGKHKFRAQSKNVYQHPGKEAVFQFRILLPWYRTWWAFLSYAIVFFCLTYLIFKWRRSIQLEKEKQKLEQTVNERTKEIEEQSEKLKEMDKVKSRFFANISHEFRTPLTLIMGPLEQILSNLQDKILKKKADMALQNSQRLLGLINQLLALSKLDSGKMKLQVSQQNIVPFIKGIISTFEPIVEKKGLYLTLKVEKEDISLYFDPEKMEHVILNLLANAVKFTPMGGKIIIGINDQTEAKEDFPTGILEISVCDTGPGIPRNQLNHIFDRFYQADSTYEKHPQGSGIGLALAKELVELHHGKLDIRSKEGQGSKFIIRLPFGYSRFSKDEIVEFCRKPYPHKNLTELTSQFNIENNQNSAIDIEDVQPNAKNEVKDHHDTDTGALEEESAQPKPEKNIILVVEDSADLRNYLRDCLESIYEVLEAKNGFEGICRAQEIIPDLIISDIMMPEIDGYQLCQKLKNDIKTSHIPIILLTAKATEENIVEGLEIGADDYITKPFSTKILYARIKNLIDQRRQLQLKRKNQITLQPKEITVSTIDDEFYHELQEVIEKNLSDSEFKVEQLANKLYLSRSSLYRKILAISGETPQQFIRAYRLKRAAQLLKANFGNVTEVSLEVGFSNLAHFTQCFKKEFNQLPSSFQSSRIES